MRAVPATATVIAVVLASPGCGDDDSSGDVVVFAAASLTESFTELGERFGREHEGVEVTFNFAASSELATQIGEGADADVFASADVANMDQVDDETIGDVGIFATNTLTILTEPGNPQGITALADLEDRDLVVVSCDPAVPVGAYTQDVFERAGVDVDIDSFEEDVKAVVTRVTLGEADTGIVYITDARAAGDQVSSVAIPDELNVRAEYPIAALDVDGAEFRDFVLSEEGRQILSEHGFSDPP